MAASDLTTIANVKQWLNINGSTDDALLTRMVTAISNYVQSWLNRQFASQAYSETRDGNGGLKMLLANYPVTAVASLAIDGQTIPVSTDINTPGFLFDQYAIYLRGYAFNRGMQNVAVQYTAGYAATPFEIEQAVIETIALRYKERDRIGHASKSIQGETVAFTITDFPKDVLTILNNYKKVISL